MTSPYYGFIFNQQDDGPLPPAFSDLSVLGLVLPSDDADATKFPLNIPVDVNTGESAVLAALGTGPLADTVNLVNNQLGDLEVSARAVVVRVADDPDIDVVIANILGNPDTGTGLYALLKSGQMLGVIPRLIGAPGYTGKFSTNGGSASATVAEKAGMVGGGALTLASPATLAGAIAGVYKVKCIGGAFAATGAAKSGMVGGGSIAMASPSVGAGAVAGVYRATCIATTGGGEFVVQDPEGEIIGVATAGVAFAGPVAFTISASGIAFAVGDAFLITSIAAVPAGGGLFSVADPNGAALANATVGVAYATQVAFTIAASGTNFAIGDEFDVTVAIVNGYAEANPICAALPAICNALMAHAVVGGPSTTKTAALAWRSTINSQRLIPVDNSVIVAKGTGTVTIDHAAAVLGLGVRMDFKYGGVPSHSWANQAVQGIIGLSRYDSFSLVDGATDGQELLAAGVGVIERGEIGSETAVGPSGFVSVALQNASTDPQWQFYNVSRTRDYTHLALLRSIRLRLGSTNVTPHGVQAVLNDMTAVLNELKAAEATIGFTVGFDPNVNSPSQLRLGQFRIYFKSEEPAPIVQVTIDSQRDYAALTVEIADIIADAATLIAQTGTSAS